MTPTLPSVAHVHGSWSTKDFRRVLVLRWQENGSTETRVETLTEGTVAAVLAWDKQPKTVTPEERANKLSQSFRRDFKGFDDVPEHVWNALATKVWFAIDAAIAVDREDRSDAPTVNQNAVSATTPAQTARAIVADWANAHRTHYADDNGFGSAPDTGRASLDDLERRIAAALATKEG